MNKSIEMTASQIKALENGATMFVFPITHPCKYYSDRNQQAIRIEPENDNWYKNRNYCIREEGGGWQDLTFKDFCEYVNFHIQKADKDVWVKEEFKHHQQSGATIYKSNYTDLYTSWTDASKMTKEQSRHILKEIVDVRVVRVQDMDSMEIWETARFKYDFWTKREWGNLYNQQMQEQNINRTYEDNDYIFLVETK